MTVKSIEQTKTRIAFPSLRETLMCLIKEVDARGFCPGMSLDELTDHIFKRMDRLRQTISTYAEGKMGEVLSAGKYLPALSEAGMAAVITNLKGRWHAPNEFFTIFDIAKGTEAYVDERVADILGLTAEEFRTTNLDIHHPAQSIYYEEDACHVLRFGLISYFMLSLPGLRCSAQWDHNLFRFRLSTNRSRIEAIRKLPYLTVERRCYLACEVGQGNKSIPAYHYDLWSVYPHLPVEYVTNTFITKDHQGEYMNAFAYLLNMYLIGISPKYILLLDERQLHDRNKSVANALCDKIKLKTGREIELDEHQVADCFAKTIRLKVEDAINAWNFRPKNNRISIGSDRESVRYAKKLGLLPIPLFVKNILYDMVAQHSMAE